MYQALYRKYRPKDFGSVVGQESLVKTLKNSVKNNSFCHAYMFFGPRGTGKTTLSKIFARTINCLSPIDGNACGKCDNCINSYAKECVDIIEIDAASNRGIQDAKDLIAQVQYAPINGKYKIFIIDEVHMLSNDAFNALLKTFEEPPKNVIFILATTEPHKVLETIVSRCQRFDLRRITTDDIIKRLREISDIENIKITDDALFTIAKNVSGGLRDSLALLDQVSILGVKDEIDKDLIEELLGKINFDVLLNLLKNINDENIELSISCVDEIYSRGNEPRNLAENFIEFLRNVILVLNSNNPETITKFTTLVSADIEKIQNCNFNKDKIVKILNTIIEYYKEIKISTNPYLWMELAALASCKLDLKNEVIIQKQPTQNIQNIQPIQNAKAVAMNMQAPPQARVEIPKAPIQQAPQIQKKSAENIVQEEQKPAEISQVSNMQVPENVAQNQDSAQIWMNIISAIPSLPTRAFYSGVAKLIGIENKTIKLGFLNDNVLSGAKSPAKLSMLEGAINSTYQGYNIEFIRIDSTTKVIETKPKIAPARPVAPPVQNEIAPASAQNPIKKDEQNQEADNEKSQMTTKEKKQYSPQVQNMIEQFNGRIID